MALQHYLKNTENYCVTATPAAQVYTTTAGVVIPHLQLQQHTTTPAFRTTTAATVTTTAAQQQQARQHNYQQQLHHFTLHHQQQQQQAQQLQQTTPNNTTQQGITTTIVATSTPHIVITQPQQQLLVQQSQQRLKQLQLKQPTIHQQHTTYHPYYQQQQQHTTNNNNNSHNNKNTNTNSVINTLVITGAANHKFKSAQHNLHQQQLQLQQQQHTNYSHNRTLPIHAALNQNSNFSAVSSSTGGTASSHAPTQQSNATNSSRSSAVVAAANARTSNANNTADSAKQQQAGGGAISMRTSAVANSNSIATNSKKIRTEPLLSQYHQTERLTFANSHLVWGEEHWRRVVFQDERKFNLDGPDGFSNYFHDLRNFQQTLSQRPRGNSVYIYILLTVGGPIHMEVSTAKQRTQTYVETIIRERANVIAKLGGNPDFILQDHNLTANMSPNTQELLEAEGIKVQRWPTIAHDLNIMENIWGWLVREVYDGGRKFARKDDLIFRIRSAWSRLPMDFVVNLYSTLPERIAELYYTRGIYTNC